MARRTRNPDTQAFNGYTYWRSDQGYYERRTGPQSRVHILLHRAVWEHRHGSIPPNHDVHHVNGDKADNSLANLELIQHGEHQKQHWLDEEELNYVCSWCGVSFTSRGRGIVKYCSMRCHMHWRRANGVDDEQRTCVICGKPYWVRRDMPQKTCSRSCGRALGTQTRRQRAQH